MSTQETPLLVFPCANYPVKVVCRPFADYENHILQKVAKFAPDCQQKPTKVAQSKGGKFVSITLYFTATGKQQLQQIHQALIAHNDILTVL